MRRTRRLPQERGGEADNFDTVHGTALRFFSELVKALGGESGPLLKFVGIDPESFAEGRLNITYRQMIQLIERAAAELDCPDFGMRLAKLQGGAPLPGPLWSVMKNSKTFGDALEYVRNHSYAHSLAARFRFIRLPGEAMFFIGHDILVDGFPCKAQMIEKALLEGVIVATLITGGHVRPRKIYFRHQQISPLTVYRRYFGCETCFGQDEDGTFYSEQDLACAIVEPDVGAYQAATSFIDRQFSRQRPPLHAEVRGLIMQLLRTGECTNERIAAELNLHPRTLHRHLVAEGTSFREVLDAIRRDQMLYYVQQTKLPFVRISERLGFAEQTVMTKSCNRWFSVCPSMLRAQGQSRFPQPCGPGSRGITSRDDAGSSILSEIDETGH